MTDSDPWNKTIRPYECSFDTLMAPARRFQEGSGTSRPQTSLLVCISWPRSGSQQLQDPTVEKVARLYNSAGCATKVNVYGSTVTYDMVHKISGVEYRSSCGTLAATYTKECVVVS